MTILISERTTSVASNAIAESPGLRRLGAGVSRNRQRELGGDVRRLRGLECIVLRGEHGADAAEHFEVGHGLPLRRISLKDSLHATLKVGIGAFLLHVNRPGEQ